MGQPLAHLLPATQICFGFAFSLILCSGPSDIVTVRASGELQARSESSRISMPKHMQHLALQQYLSTLGIFLHPQQHPLLLRSKIFHYQPHFLWNGEQTLCLLLARPVVGSTWD